jgi:hypothetical protein
MATKKIKLNPASYYKAVYAANGNYENEKKFDTTAGLEWISGYTFEVKDAVKWKSVKEKLDILLDKKE